MYLCYRQSSQQTVSVRAHSRVQICLGAAICEQISDVCVRVWMHIKVFQFQF
jgi:hypothetical protein